MAGLAQLTVAPLTIGVITDPGLVIQLDLVRFPEGFPNADPSWVVEPVIAQGVNFSRLRLVRRQYKAFKMLCSVGYATYAAAVTATRAWRQLVGHQAQLQYTAGGTLYVLTGNMNIGDVVAHPFPGEYIAVAPNVPGAMGSVDGVFDLQFNGT